MNPIAFEVTLASGEKVTAKSVAPDFVAFETKFDRSISSLSKDIRITDMLFLAWHALKRTGVTPLEFEAWAETVENLTVAEGKA